MVKGYCAFEIQSINIHGLRGRGAIKSHFKASWCAYLFMKVKIVSFLVYAIKYQNAPKTFPSIS